MKKFVSGFILGAMAGVVASAVAAQIVGGNGWLRGWEVTKDGETICDEPYVWVGTREIECD